MAVRIEAIDPFDEIKEITETQRQLIKEIDMKRVHDMTMNKISTEKTAAKKRGLSKTAKIIIAAAACAALLTTGVFAAVRTFSLRENIGVNSYSFGSEGTLDYAGEDSEYYDGYDADIYEADYSYDVGVEITLPANEKYGDKLCGFKASYLPELPDYLEGQHDKLTDDASWYYVASGEKCSYSISMVCPGLVDKQCVIEGKSQTVKEGEINGFAATYLTVDQSEIYESYTVANIILLSDEETGSIIVVTGREMPFEELEPIAEGIELCKTDVRNESANSEFGGIFGYTALG